MRNLAMTVFGVIPASTLCYFVLPISIYTVGDYLDKGGMDILITLVLCMLAVIGTFALYFSIGSAPGPVRIVGLGCGLIAMYGLDGFSNIGLSLWSLMFAGPVAIAVLLIIEGIHTRINKPDDPDHWSY